MSKKLQAARGIRATRYTTQDQGGGNKLQGLGGQSFRPSPTKGIGRNNGARSAMFYNNNIFFCVNQIGGVGRSGGNGRSLHSLQDGTNCFDNRQSLDRWPYKNPYEDSHKDPIPEPVPTNNRFLEVDNELHDLINKLRNNINPSYKVSNNNWSLAAPTNDKYIKERLKQIGAYSNMDESCFETATHDDFVNQDETLKRVNSILKKIKNMGTNATDVYPHYLAWYEPKALLNYKPDSTYDSPTKISTEEALKKVGLGHLLPKSKLMIY